MDPGESLVFPVALDVPPWLHVGGHGWHRRPELHVTTFTPADLAQEFSLDLAALLAAGDEHRETLTRRRAIGFDGRIARVAAPDGRRTLVAFCDVAGLDDVYRRLSAAIGRALPVPPTHVTLYTSQPGMQGIGLSTGAQVHERATLLADDEATAVVRHLPARAK